MRKTAFTLLLALGFSMAPAMSAQTPPRPPVVVELFTSQSCSSCPPAEAAFRDLARRPDLVALEWHVDYWDEFEDRVGGRNKDPFSARAHTARQILYNRRLRNSDQVFTPQTVIGGAAQATGTDQSAIRRAVSSQAGAAQPVRISATRGTNIAFALANLPADAELWLVTFQRDVSTEVTRGENHGRRLASSNVVTGYRQLRPAASFTAALPAEGSGCALLVHAKGQGAILGAAYCPA
jgi:hypothetical protein